MVKVRVRQDDRVDGRRGDRQSLPIPLAQIARALEQSAIHQDTPTVPLGQVLRTGDGSGAAEARQSQHLGAV